MEDNLPTEDEKVEIINFVLKNMNSGRAFLINNILNKKYKFHPAKWIFEIVAIMEINKLIKDRNGYYEAKISKLGYEINECGGWVKYKEKQRQLAKQDELLKKIEFDNAISESDKLKYEKKLRGLDVSLAKSNIESNKITSKNSKISLIIALVTILALITQIGLNQYNESKRKEHKKTEELLKTKSKQLKVYTQKADSLTLLLSIQNVQKKEKKE